MFSVFSVEELSVLVVSVVALVWLCVSSSTDEVFVSIGVLRKARWDDPLRTCTGWQDWD